MQYELVLTVRARNCSFAITSNLLPEVIATVSDSMLAILISAKYRVDDPIVGSMEIDDVFELANKIELDVHTGKYKWQIEKK